MPDISFASFNPRSFEQFAQALAGLVLGPGLLVFGDGPDGGREASFTGQVPYPSSSETWSGHIVVQAKFHLSPTRDRRDADWLVAQIAAEAARVAGISPRPDHYIVITNIRLSGVQGKERKGGQQKVADAFESHLKPLGVVSMHVWHEEKIATLLDAHPGLLRSYGAWLSPRDVLSAVFESFADRVPDFGETMLRLLQRELRDQRDTRLRQAGHVGDASTPLESVFVDLPYGVPMEGAEARMDLLQALKPSGGSAGIVADLLALTSLKLDPETVTRTFPDASHPPPVRHLVLGGPGQGKSTISQFLAQVARARLLASEPAHRITAETRPVLSATLERMRELGMTVDGPARYPLRVDLPTFADALARAERDGAALSLLGFLAARMEAAATAPGLDVAVMRRWLRSYPWLLVLDGLDEVPPSGNRARLLEAITDFWDEATLANADVAMVVTTRPQGYNDDLDPKLHVRHELARLDPGRALDYARGLALLAIGDVERREDVLERLRAAAENPTTALLMVSPLQVAILLQLVEQRGAAPTDRWTLFEEYLGIVVKREQEKKGEAGRVVREQQFVIDGMLRRAGLLLHVEAEHQGGAEASLELDRLRGLARDLLAEEGHGGDRLDALAEEIVDAATDRLVFLEQRVEGRVEFEVRSLQEFMAAAELMAGGDDVVGERLHAIAGRNHWQHVYRIAASKAFSKRDAAKYRDTIIAANARLEADDPSAKATRRGGALALALLEDGVAHQQPAFRRTLLDQALGLLALGPVAVESNLVDAIAAGGLDNGLSTLESKLASVTADERVAAWQALFALTLERGDDADRLVVARWPVEPPERIEIAASCTPPALGTDAWNLVRAAFDEAGPLTSAAALSIASRASNDRLDPALKARLPHLASLRGGAAESQVVSAGLLDHANPTVSLKLVTIEGARQSGYLDFPSSPEWRATKPLQAFVAAPGLETLASFAESLIDEEVVEVSSLVAGPWLTGTIAELVRQGAEPHAIAAEIRSGGFGGPGDWQAAEVRWQARGVTTEDVDLWAHGTFVDERVAEIGAPFAHTISRRSQAPGNHAWLLALTTFLTAAVESAPARQMRRILAFSLGPAVPPRKLEAFEAKAILAPRGDRSVLIRADAVTTISPSALESAELLDILARIGEQPGYAMAPERAKPTAESMASLVLAHPSAGMLNLACALLGLRAQELRQLASMVGSTLPVGDHLEASTALLLYLAGLGSLESAVTAATAEGRENVEQHVLLHIAQDQDTSDIDELRILSALATKTDREQGPVRGEAMAALRRAMDRRTSDLHLETTWRSLDLPPAVLNMIVRMEDG